MIFRILGVILLLRGYCGVVLLLRGTYEQVVLLLRGYCGVVLLLGGGVLMNVCDH